MKKVTKKQPKKRLSIAHCEHKKTKPHSCPFQFDVNNNDSFKCTCCENCQRDCAQAI